MFRTWPHLAPLPLRLILGFGMMYHGYPKLFDAAQRQGFVGMLQGIGIPAPGVMAWVVAIVEFVGGLALIVGAFVSIVAVLLIIEMLVAMITVHLPHGFNFLNITGMEPGGPTFGMPGYEVNLLYIAGLLALLLAGAGAYSFDQRRTVSGVGSSPRTGPAYPRPGEPPGRV